MSVKEFMLVKNKYNHPSLKETYSCDWYGDGTATDQIYDFLTAIYNMDCLAIERTYVVGFDTEAKIKGVMLVGQGDMVQSPMSLNNIFTFLLLTGSYSFVVAHNHVNSKPLPSVNDSAITNRIASMANNLDIKFLGHMIISSDDYMISGGSVGYFSTFDDEENEDDRIEYFDNGMAATYIFDQRIEGKAEDIEKIVYGDGGKN